MLAINAQSLSNPAASVSPLPQAVGTWTAAHYFYRVHDPASFSWLNDLGLTSAGQPAKFGTCFGMEVAYLALDALLWFPEQTVLAIPLVEVPPPEFFFVCNSGGQRWWCFVVLRRQGVNPTALVLDIDPSVLLIVGLGLRETSVNAGTGVPTQRRDFPIAPNPAVLCPMDDVHISYQRTSPASGEYFRLSEGRGATSGAPASTVADALGLSCKLPQTASIEVAIGSPVLGLRMGINDDPGLMRLVDSLAANDAGGVL